MKRIFRFLWLLTETPRKVIGGTVLGMGILYGLFKLLDAVGLDPVVAGMHIAKAFFWLMVLFTGIGVLALLFLGLCELSNTIRECWRWSAITKQPAPASSVTAGTEGEGTK
jgi:hypothetical protein